MFSVHLIHRSGRRRGGVIDSIFAGKKKKNPACLYYMKPAEWILCGTYAADEGFDVQATRGSEFNRCTEPSRVGFDVRAQIR